MTQIQRKWWYRKPVKSLVQPRQYLRQVRTVQFERKGWFFVVKRETGLVKGFNSKRAAGLNYEINTFLSYVTIDKIKLCRGLNILKVKTTETLGNNNGSESLSNI